jgi:hypothetical protein
MLGLLHLPKLELPEPFQGGQSQYPAAYFAEFPQGVFITTIWSFRVHDAIEDIKKKQAVDHHVENMQRTEYTRHVMKKQIFDSSSRQKMDTSLSNMMKIFFRPQKPFQPHCKISRPVLCSFYNQRLI